MSIIEKQEGSLLSDVRDNFCFRKRQDKYFFFLNVPLLIVPFLVDLIK